MSEDGKLGELAATRAKQDAFRERLAFALALSKIELVGLTSAREGVDRVWLCTVRLPAGICTYECLLGKRDPYSEATARSIASQLTAAAPSALLGQELHPCPALEALVRLALVAAEHGDRAAVLADAETIRRALLALK